MATVKIAFGGAMGAGVPAYPAKPRAAETITSSASSQTSTNTAKAGEFAHVFASGGAVDVSVSVDASATTGWMVTDGAAVVIGPLKESDDVRIKDI